LIPNSPHKHAIEYKSIKDVETFLNGIVMSLDLDWEVKWIPSETGSSKRGECVLEEKTIFIHDHKLEDALETLIHEIVEIHLRSIIKPYRILCNKLIEVIDELTYEKKEEKIQQLIKTFNKVKYKIKQPPQKKINKSKY
jgi:hypothetical protein